MKEEEQMPDERRALLRTGAVCGVLGGPGFFVLGFTHGDLPAGAEDALRYVAERPDWQAVHLGAVICALLWVAAFVALAASVSHGAAGALGRLAVASIAVGAAVAVVDFSVDGYALRALAEAWASAPAAQKGELVGSGETLLLILSGTFCMYVSFLFGLPFLLGGLAVAFSRTYPAWLGWAGAVAGTGSLVSGMAFFLDAGIVPDVLVFALFLPVVNLWLAVMGVLMWRRASVEATDAAEVPHDPHERPGHG